MRRVLPILLLLLVVGCAPLGEFDRDAQRILVPPGSLVLAPEKGPPLVVVGGGKPMEGIVLRVDEAAILMTVSEYHKLVTRK